MTDHQNRNETDHQNKKNPGRQTLLANLGSGDSKQTFLKKIKKNYNKINEIY